MRSASTKTRIQNRLLQALTAEEYRRLSRKLQDVHLPRGRVLYEPGNRADFVYFPLSGVVSLLSSTRTGQMVEVGMVGNEGTTWIPVINHAQALPYQVLIQIS